MWNHGQSSHIHDNVVTTSATKLRREKEYASHQTKKSVYIQVTRVDSPSRSLNDRIFSTRGRQCFCCTRNTFFVCLLLLFVLGFYRGVFFYLLHSGNKPFFIFIFIFKYIQYLSHSSFSHFVFKYVQEENKTNKNNHLRIETSRIVIADPVSLTPNALVGLHEDIREISWINTINALRKMDFGERI
jgi:hypothetical protein